MPKPKPLPPLDQVRAVLKYDPESPSGLTRIARTAHNAPAGAHAGFKMRNGYWGVSVLSRQVYAHRLIWLLVHGEDPGSLQLDHANGDQADNRISNLRLATGQQNAFNGRSRKGSSSRWLGVTWNAANGTWQAQIKTEGRNVNLGQFRCETAAAIAYHKEAVRTRGEFARSSFTHPQED